MYINNFNNLINKYNYFLFDLWGVLYQNSSDKNIKGIEEINKIFSEIRKKKKYIYIVSN
jgi:ribonucleotide monophosphatase NagD (HAD superfamily)